ncbi:MAG: cytochrome P450 [Actinobacteria bacterium]|nr:cytochrome P450 [Actinomycetota bacterium]
MTDSVDAKAAESQGAPVTDWARDYDIYDPAYVADPHAIWADLRSRCPIAHSDRHGGSWLPTRYADVSAIAHDVEHFSSREVSVVPPPTGDANVIPLALPPLQTDPPEHTWSRRLLLPWFTPQRVAGYERATRTLCQLLIDRFVDQGAVDAALQYTQQIPVFVIAHVLGVPHSLADTFTTSVRAVLDFTNEPVLRVAARDEIVRCLLEQMVKRRQHPGTDLLSGLVHAEVDGKPLSDLHILGTAALTLIAGIDTTASALGTMLWHLATHEADRERLVERRELLPGAIEELLRAYSPVTMARVATVDTNIGGCPVRAGDRVLLNFPAANRDPEVFPEPDRVVLDRGANRHLAFGTGIHRCAGSHLARMELLVALDEWLTQIPSFVLAEPDSVRWTSGQVRGPRNLPLSFVSPPVRR